MTTLSQAGDAAEVVAGDLETICDDLQSELPRLDGKHLLITGGAGFLGYYLVQTVLHRNRNLDPPRRCQVTVYDNFSRGVPDWLLSPEGGELHLVEHDVVRPLPDTLDHTDYIIHAASIASPTYYREHPIETMDANVIGFRRLLDYARAEGDAGRNLEGFLYFSTSEIYGDPDPASIPTSEGYRGNVSCTGPRACYDESKRYGETLCVNFARQYGVPVTVARPFNNYGPGLSIKDRRLLPDLAADVFANRDVVLLSDGQATRTFCYIADAICGYFRVLLRGRPAEAYNIGVEEPEVTVREFADRVVAIARRDHNYQGSITGGISDDPEYLIDNPNRRCPVINKAREELGYHPEVELDDGIARTLTWYSGNRG